MAGRFGWRRDKLDPRDYQYRLRGHLQEQVYPQHQDLRDACPPVYDQGDLGSCTANAIVAALEFDQGKQGQLLVMPSRLFVYYNERDMEGTIESDAGAEIRDGIKSVVSLGVCPEVGVGTPDNPSPAFWPYDISKFTQRPSTACYFEAEKHQALKYLSVQQELVSLYDVLTDGYPVIFGFTVYPAFQSDEVAQTGIVPMPHFWSTPVGGHAVLIVGYDRVRRLFIVRNSWGDQWGDKGYFYMPFDYVLSSELCSDFWTIQSIE